MTPSKPDGSAPEHHTIGLSTRIAEWLKDLFFRIVSGRILDWFSAAAMAEGSQKLAKDYIVQADLTDELAAKLRLEFKMRYHHFKSLLQANNSALENMADIEKALSDTRPFSMAFVKQKVIGTSVDVYRMIRCLEEISPGKYGPLATRFEEIQQTIDCELKSKRAPGNGQLVMPLSGLDHQSEAQIGSKMANLAEIHNRLDIPVPRGFVITAEAYDQFFEANGLPVEIDKILQVTDIEDLSSLEEGSDKIQQLIMASPLPEIIETQINSAYAAVFSEAKDLKVVMRSSAAFEDYPGMSFAGQYCSQLNIDKSGLIKAYKCVIASKYSPQAIVYRFTRGLRDEDIPMCVGCMEMVDTTSGGVIYTRNPLDPEQQSMSIDASWGLPKTVVEGESDCDYFEVSRETPYAVTFQRIASKKVTPTQDYRAIDPSLNPDQISQLAALALRIEQHFKEPQDIEWGIDPNGRIVVFQSRPLSEGAQHSQRLQASTCEQSQFTLVVERGTTVSAGTCVGKVYRIESKSDLLEMPPGSIAVFKQPLPRWATALSKSVGIIAETGGYAGHLANVSREQNLPALFGIQNATSLLENGDLVTLDADCREIHKGRIDAILTRKPPRQNLMAGSPVYEALAKASRLIVPLHLLDPESSDFRASQVKTLHDITRFIHEKSMVEMFDFGKTHHFSERSGKQLYYKVPMHWWILNLDDGFTHEIQGRFVTLDQIASQPMLALWDGMVAFPWEGPPPIDGRGFLSVMLQSTSNTALTIGGKSRFVDKNYFMITKNFCNLASKLGFHFTTVEALIDEESEENYICFRYKGGAADYKRRIGRVKFLAEILENYRFFTEIRQDTLTARIESDDEEFIKERLRILGYLIIHTRQIDMIMLNPSTVNYYKEKFASDISSLIKAEEQATPLTAANDL